MVEPTDNLRYPEFLHLLDECQPSQLEPHARSARLKELLVTEIQTGFDVRLLRGLAEASALENALSHEPSQHEHILSAIAACIPVGQPIRTLDDKNWTEGVEIGKAFAQEKMFPFSNARIKEVGDAGRRLQKIGYKLRVSGTHYEMLDGGMEIAAGKIKSTFESIGPTNALGNLFNGLKTNYPSDFEIYIPHRRYLPGDGQRQASIPYGYLINLAANVAFPKSIPPQDNATEWTAAIDLARDLVAIMNLEPYYNLAYFNTPTLRLESTLRELALFDHLFALRQWRLRFTVPFISIFFDEDYDKAFQALGWTKNDVIALVTGLTHFATRDPILITLSALRQSGIDGRLLDKMLSHFAFDYSAVNVEYLTPLSAEKADLMFKPLIRHGLGHVLIPSKNLLGPAIFEATMAAIRPHMSRDVLSKLSGAGTERVTRSLFARSGLQASFASSKYKIGIVDEGECDLVYETETVILLVECKAKPLTRGAMAGTSGDALLDFAGGMFSAQKQAIAHERVLRLEGQIEFENGCVLPLNSRRIVRLSVTLLDHGALQDRTMLFNLYGALQQAEVRADRSYGKSRQVTEFNKALQDLRSEILQLEAAGIDAPAQPINSASLSVAQLDILLDDVGDLDAFLQRVARPVSFSTLNPLAELHYLRVQGFDV